MRICRSLGCQNLVASGDYCELCQVKQDFIKQSVPEPPPILKTVKGAKNEFKGGWCLPPKVNNVIFFIWGTSAGLCFGILIALFFL